MERKKTMALLALGLVAAVMLSPMIVQATSSRNQFDGPTNQNTKAARPFQAASASRVRALGGSQKGISIAQQQCEAPLRQRNKEERYLNSTMFNELPEFDEKEIDLLLSEYEAMLESDDVPKGGLWILWAGGASWPLVDETDVNDVAPEDPLRCGMRLAIRPVIALEDIVVFKVVRGVVDQDGERHKVEGVGVLFKEEGVFVMKLEGEGLSLKAIGRVHRGRWSLRVDMKGRMTVDGVDYAFRMRGRAFRLRPLTAEAFPAAKGKLEPTISS
jgi:hypothetical protein